MTLACKEKEDCLDCGPPITFDTSFVPTLLHDYFDVAPDSYWIYESTDSLGSNIYDTVILVSNKTGYAKSNLAHRYYETLVLEKKHSKNNYNTDDQVNKTREQLLLFPPDYRADISLVTSNFTENCFCFPLFEGKNVNFCNFAKTDYITVNLLGTVSLLDTTYPNVIKTKYNNNTMWFTPKIGLLKLVKKDGTTWQLHEKSLILK